MSPARSGRYDPADLAEQDEPVRRFFAHALAPGAPTGEDVRLRMRGRVRAGRWLPFTAHQTVGRRGFVWRARVGWGPLTLLEVRDAYADGAAATEVRLFGRIRLSRATGPDTVRSAAGRAALEAVASAPGSVIPGEGATWRAESNDVITATLEMPPERVKVRVLIDGRGAPREIAASRWGPAGRRRFAYLECACRVLEERGFGPYRLPSRLMVAWTREGRHEPFFEARIEGVGEPPAPAPGWRRPARAVAEALEGVALMAFAAVTPGHRAGRARWGLDPALAARRLPGDELVPAPRWGWTHAVEIAAPADAVWPWLAQIGADRAGFYSYELLENLAGCRVRNADVVRPEWEVRAGGAVSLHPRQPALPVVELVPGRHFVAHAAADRGAAEAGRPWVAASWLFLVEPLGSRRSRVVSRYRCASSGDRRTRLLFGPALLEPIGWAMDRRMLLGLRGRAERAGSPWWAAAGTGDLPDAAKAAGSEHSIDGGAAPDHPEEGPP
jgi:hypothetical protein